MTSRERMLAAIGKQKPDVLPVTTHHIMPSFLDKYYGGISNDAFFDRFGFDAINWTVPHKADPAKGQYYDEQQGTLSFLDSRRIFDANWRIEMETLPHPSYTTVRYNIITPGGNLTTVLQSNQHTTWVAEHLIKEKQDIEILAQYETVPTCDIGAVAAAATAFGDRGIVRGHLLPTNLFGQPGCWQDACCIVGTERLIMESYDDPEWVHHVLSVLQKRKLAYIATLAGAKYDILELGGGDGCLSVINPSMFREFVAPYDAKLIAAAHDVGQKIVYHLCGSKMGILEDIVGMNPDAIETFTPVGMGGDVNLAKAKQVIGNRCCMIGGFDQFHFFVGCTPQETRDEVKRCFAAAGEGGGYIIAPSDHFFEAEEELLFAFVDEAHRCAY